MTTYFILFYKVVDNMIERRAPFRDEHLSMLNRLKDQGSLLMAGALADPVDSSVLIFKSETDAKQFTMEDPYVKNGLVTSWEVRPWNVAVSVLG